VQNLHQDVFSFYKQQFDPAQEPSPMEALVEFFREAETALNGL
jgi:hypothetical protein